MKIASARILVIGHRHRRERQLALTRRACRGARGRTCSPCHGRSVRVRQYSLCTRVVGCPHTGHAAERRRLLAPTINSGGTDEISCSCSSVGAGHSGLASNASISPTTAKAILCCYRKAHPITKIRAESIFNRCLHQYNQTPPAGRVPLLKRDLVRSRDVIPKPPTLSNHPVIDKTNGVSFFNGTESLPAFHCSA